MQIPKIHMVDPELRGRRIELLNRTLGVPAYPSAI